MSESAGIGIGIDVRSNYAEALQLNIKATQELTTAINSLASVISNLQSVSQQLNSVVANTTEVTKTATDANIKAAETTLKVAASSSEVVAVINTERSGWINLAESILAETKSSEDAVSALVNLGAKKREATAIVDGLTNALNKEAQAQRAVAESPGGVPGRAMQDMGYWKAQAQAKNEEAVARERNAQASQAESVSVERTTTITRQNTVATEEQVNALNKATGATEKHGTAVSSAWHQSFIFFGMAMMLNSAIQQIAASQEEKANPAMMQFGRIAQEVASGALVGAMVPGAGMAGIAIGSLAGLIMGLGIATLTADPQVAQLNKTLDTLAKKDESVETLAELLDLTKEDAIAMMDLAKSSQEAARAVRDYVEAKKEMSGLEKFARIEAEGFQIIGDVLGVFISRSKETIDTNESLKASLIGTAVVLGILIPPLGAVELLATGAAVGFSKLTEKFDENRAKAAALAAEQVEIEKRVKAINDAFKDAEGIFSADAKIQNAINTFSAYANVSKEVIANVIENKSKHAELGAEIDKDIEAIREAEVSLTRYAAGSTAAAIAAGNLSAYQQKLTDDILAFQRALDFDAASKAYRKLAADLEKANRDIVRAQSDTAREIEKVHRDTAKRLEEIDYQEGQARIKALQDQAKIEDNLRDALMKAQQTLADALYKAARDLANREQDIREQLMVKLQDLEHNYLKSKQDAYHSIVEKERDLANKIFDINRQLREDLAALDWNIGEQLRKAHTENDKEEILRRSVFERAQLLQKAEDSRSDAQRSLDDAKRVAAEKLKLIDEEYAYERQKSIDEANRQVEDARRTYAQQVEDARRRNAEMVADAQHRYQEEMQALAIRTAREEEQFRHQRLLARQNDIERVNDLRARLAQEIADIQQRYAIERQEILATLTYAQQAMLFQLEALARLQAAFAALKAVMSLVGGGSVPDFSSILGAGKASGGEVKAGMLYPVGERGVELFAPKTDGTIIPNEKIGNYGSQTNHFYIYDASDPKRVAEAVRQELQQLRFG